METGGIQKGKRVNPPTPKRKTTAQKIEEHIRGREKKTTTHGLMKKKNAGNTQKKTVQGK